MLYLPPWTVRQKEEPGQNLISGYYLYGFRETKIVVKVSCRANSTALVVRGGVDPRPKHLGRGQRPGVVLAFHPSHGACAA